MKEPLGLIIRADRYFWHLITVLERPCKPAFSSVNIFHFHSNSFKRSTTWDSFWRRQSLRCHFSIKGTGKFELDLGTAGFCCASAKHMQVEEVYKRGLQRYPHFGCVWAVLPVYALRLARISIDEYLKTYLGLRYFQTVAHLVKYVIFPFYKTVVPGPFIHSYDNAPAKKNMPVQDLIRNSK